MTSLDGRGEAGVVAATGVVDDEAGDVDVRAGGVVGGGWGGETVWTSRRGRGRGKGRGATSQVGEGAVAVWKQSLPRLLERMVLHTFNGSRSEDVARASLHSPLRPTSWPSATLGRSSMRSPPPNSGRVLRNIIHVSSTAAVRVDKLHPAVAPFGVVRV